MMPLALIPRSWLIGAGLVLALGAGHLYRVSAAYDRGHAAAVSERAGRDLVAVVQRTSDNAVLSIKQDSINAILTKVKNEELAPVVKRIYVDRVRVGPAICNGPATPTEAEGTAGGDSANPPGRLVRDDIDRDLKALMVAVEQDLATGRACQAFILGNGLVP